jgi:anti-sigma factor RsiW
MISSHHLGETVSAYLDGELTAEERRAAVAHVAGCEECRQELDDMMSVRAQLRAMPMLELPAELGPPEPVVRRLYRRPRVVVGAAAAAVAVVVTAATLSAPNRVVISADEFAQSYGARASLDPNSSVRIIQPADLNAITAGDGE